MYIESIRIKGFRNFVDSSISFNEEINAIIGHNNAGKSNLLKALALVLNSSFSRRLEVEDFNKNVVLDDLKHQAPEIRIELKIIQSQGEDLNSDDLVTVANWLVNLSTPYTALLTYEFFLPETELEEYGRKMSTATDNKNAWNIIKHEFIRKYVSKIYGGHPDSQSSADTESLNKFDFQFLDAIRDVERDMFSGRNTLLREVLDFFMDYEIKSDAAKNSHTKAAEIKEKKINFSEEAVELLRKLQVRMESGQKKILQYAHDTGASFNNAIPAFDGAISNQSRISLMAYCRVNRLQNRLTTGIGSASCSSFNVVG